MVNISHERYSELCECERVLDALYAAGVDNWDGFEGAIEDAQAAKDNE